MDQPDPVGPTQIFESDSSPDTERLSSPEAHRFRLEWLMKQSETHDLYLRESLRDINQMMTFAFTVIAAGATILFYYRVYAIGYVLPLAFVAAGYMGMNNTAEMFAVAAHRDFVDRQISGLLEEESGISPIGKFVPPGVSIGKARRYSISNFVLQFIFGLGGAVCGYACLFFAWHNSGGLWWLGLIAGVLYTVLLLVAIPTIIQLLNTYDDVQREMIKWSGFDPSDPAAPAISHRSVAIGAILHKGRQAWPESPQGSHSLRALPDDPKRHPDRPESRSQIPG